MLLQLPTDRLVLEELQHGADLGANIADRVDRHRKTVTKRLNQLEDYGLVRGKGRGVYELTAAGAAALVLIEHHDDPEFDDMVKERAEEIELVPFHFIDHHTE
jgi:Mn-dependent DtxR family transcriptional regulator